MVDFADLIPSKGGEPESSLAFDDLIPAKPDRPTPAPVTRLPPAPNRSGIPMEPPAPTSSRDATDLRPSSKDRDPFADEGLLDTAKRRGQQAVAGATEAFASVPEGVELLNRQRERVVNRSATEVLPQLMQERDELEAILAEMRPKAKAGDWEAGARVKAAEQRLFMVNGQIQMASRMKDDSGRALDRPIEDTLGFQAGRGLRENVEKTVGKPDPRDQGFWGKVAYGAGNVVGMGATAVGTAAVLGPGAAMAVGAAQGGAMNQSQIYKEAIAAGVDEETALAASNLGLAVGMSEILPLSRALKILGGGKASSTFMRKALEVAKNSGEEGLQEFAAQVANNMIAQGYYDPERGTFQGAGEAFAIGAILGGATSTAATAVTRDRQDDPKPQVTTGETAPDQEAALKGATTPPATAPAAPSEKPPASAADVALDEKAALSPEAAVDQVLGAQPAPEAAPVTPEGKPEAPAAPETAGDTVPTVPEAPATIATQNQALVDPKNKRKAVFIPNSSYEAGEVDEPEGRTIGRIVVPEGVIFFNKAKGYTTNDVRQLYKSGRLGTVLGLGEFTKADAAASAAKGNPEVAVTERTPEGVEVKAAAGTTETAPEQLAALNAEKTPGNTVQVESPAKVLADRLAGRQVPQPSAPSPVAAAPVPESAPVQQATEQVVQPTEQVASEATAPSPAPSPAAQALTGLDTAASKAASVREQAIRALEPQLKDMGLTVEQVLAMKPDQQRRTIEKAKQARPKSEAPKAAAVMQVAKAREEAAKPAAKAEAPKPAVTSEGKPTEPTYEYQTAPDGALVRVETDPDTGKKTFIRTTQEIEEAYNRWNRQVRSVLTEQNASAKSEERAEQRQTGRSQIEEKVRTGEIKDAVAETDALIEAGGKNLTDDEKATLRKNAEIAGKLLDKYAPDSFKTISKMEDKKALLERLNAIIAEANQMGFAWGRKGVTAYNARAVVWLYDVRTFQRKLETNPGKATYKELNTFLADEVAAKKGDVRNMKDRRREVGEQMSKPSGTGNVDQVADGNENAGKGDNEVSIEDLAGEKRASKNLKLPQRQSEGAASEVRSRTDLLAEYAAKYNTRPKDVSAMVRPNMNAATASGGTRKIDGSEATFATRTLTMKDAEAELATPEALAVMTDGQRGFSEKQRKLQRAIAKEIFKAFNRVAGDVQIHVLQDADMDLFYPEADAYYNRKGDYIAIRQSVMDSPTAALHTVIHEGAHAVFEHTIKQSPVFRDQLEVLLDIAKTYAAADNFQGSKYGLTDIHEFLSEAWSNPEFQEFLATVPISRDMRASLAIRTPEAVSVRSVWQWLKTRLVDMLGIRQAFTSAGYAPTDKSLLELSLDVSARILDIAPKGRDKYYAERPQDRPAAVRPMERDELKGKLVARGLSSEQAERVAKAIRDKYAGKVTDEQLDQIAALLKPVTADGKGAEAVATKIAASTKAAGKKALDKVAADLKDEFVPGKDPGNPRWLSLATNYQLGEIADRFFGENNPVRTIAKWMERRRTAKAQYIEQMGKVVEKLAAAQKKHKRKDWEAFVMLAHDATMANVHPDRSLEDNTHLGKNALKGVWSKSRHAGLAARYNALPAELKALYLETRDTLTEAQNTMSRKLMENILERAGHPDKALAKRFHNGIATEADRKLIGEDLAAHLEAAGELKRIEGPYFNLVRRGKFVVQGTYKVTVPTNAKQIEPNVLEFKTRKEAEVFARQQELRPTIKSIWVDKKTGKLFAVDDDGTEVKVSKQDTDAVNRFRVTVQNRHVEFVDTRGQAKARAKQLREAGLTVNDVEEARWERNAKNSEMLSDQMRAVMTTLDKRAAYSNLSPAQKAEMVGALNEISLRFLGSTRIQSTRLPRRYVEGASKDLIRNTFDYVDHASGYLARLDTAPALEDAMKELEARVKNLSSLGEGKGGGGARAVSNEITKRALDDNYGNQDGGVNAAVNRVNGWSFIGHLMSPAYSLFNSMQVGMVSLPVLSGDFNPGGASYNLIKAYYDIGAARTGLKGVGKTVAAVAGGKGQGNYLSDITGRLKEKRERDLLNELAQDGLIDLDGGMEVERMAVKPQGAARIVDIPMDYLSGVARALPQAVEAINRTVTALAAYRMMYARTKDHAKSVKYAADVVNDTQGNYSATNAPPIFNNWAGRMILQFKKYGQMIYYLLGKNIGRAYRGGGKSERRKGLMTLAYIAATHQLMAGTLGLPWEPVKFAMMLLNGFLEDDEEVSWEDFKGMIEDWYKELTGSDKAAEVLTYGLSRGIPGGWDFDMQSRVGMDSIMTFGEPKSDSDADTKAFLFDNLGASISMGYNMFKALTSIAEDDFAKNAAALLPVKVIADTIRAARGLERGTMNEQDAVMRVLGLTSGRQARANQEKGEDIREARAGEAARDRVVRDLLNARTTAEIQAAIDRAKEFNAGVPEGGRTVSIKPLLKRRQLEADKEKQRQ